MDSETISQFLGILNEGSLYKTKILIVQKFVTTKKHTYTKCTKKNSRWQTYGSRVILHVQLIEQNEKPIFNSVGK